MMARLDAVLAQVADAVDPIEARRLLGHVLGQTSAWCFAHTDAMLRPDQVAAFRVLIRRRQHGEPIAYLLGRRSFWTFELDVSPATLIPRPETETLVEAVLAHVSPAVAARLADIGTGCGAIALALAQERPMATVIATDQSRAALEIANVNRQRCELTNVSFRHGNWCEPLDGRDFDVIVSNPPYIAANDRHLSQGDLRFEPLSALVGGPDGLDAIRQLSAQARDYLRRGGWLMLEHGWDQGDAVRTVLRAAGYVAVRTLRDLEERERVTLGVRPHSSL